MVIGLIDQGNIQQYAMSRGLQTRGSLTSKQERIRRFFSHQIIDFNCLSQALVQTLFNRNPQDGSLIFGQHSTNFLVLAARVGSMSTPVNYFRKWYH